eukprot:m.14238 g.14238  ORF g.14238 m.14238 type:complete len:149 (+) comp7800_c0_seq1:136-582(+)
MGRKKSKRKAPPKKSAGKLATQFSCPFCNHENACEVKIDKTRNFGTVTCKVCSESFQTRTTYLSEPIDVYTSWIDACEAAEAGEAAGSAGGGGGHGGSKGFSSGGGGGGGGGGRGRREEYEDDDEDDDDVLNHPMLGHRHEDEDGRSD